MEVKAYSLAILGDKGVGKTSFSYRFTQNEFYVEDMPTVGAEYFQKIFYYNNQSIKLDIYGSSGNEKYKKLTKYIYKDARSIILMYKINDKSTFDHLKNYLDDIRQNSVENPIIYIVGNFADKLRENTELLVDQEEIKNFILEQNLKSYEISCKNGNGIKEIIHDLTKEILVTGKWYISKIFKDLGDINALEKAEKENDKLKKNLKVYLKDKKPNYSRCQACEKLLIIKFKTMFNEISFICNHCNYETNIPFANLDSYIESLNQRIYCSLCKKKNESKSKLNYCYKCKDYICISCEKTHDKTIKLKGEEGHYLCPYYLMDIACYKDVKKTIGYCKMCKQSFCSKCNNEHKRHEFMYFDDFIQQLSEEGKMNIARETALLKEFKDNCEDCINTLRNKISQFISIKEREIKLKEQLINQLSNIQYNYQLIETVRNLRFIKKINYNKKSTWDQKLTDIFEVLGSPIEIKTINISQDKNSYLIPEKIRLGYDHQNPLDSEVKEITDICSMNSDKYMGVCFNDGSLELYENLVRTKEPLSIFQMFDKGQPINSIKKSTRNVNNFFLCGQYKIKNVEFFDNYKSYKIIYELVNDQKIFELCLEQNDYIITSDVYNKIELFSKDNKKLEDISSCIDQSCSKHIISINEISNDKIYINFNKISEDNEGVIRGRCSSMNLDLENMTMDFSEGENNIKQAVELGTKIIELNYNRIKRQYLLPNNQEVFGVLNDNLILIRDEVNGSIILFDVNSFKNTQRFYLDLGGKPIYSGILNRRINLIDFILLDDKLNIFQNIYNEENKTIIQISGLKNKNDGLEVDPEALKRGKIIQNPFQSIINYIGDNDFIILNY